MVAIDKGYNRPVWYRTVMLLPYMDMFCSHFSFRSLDIDIAVRTHTLVTDRMSVMRDLADLKLCKGTFLPTLT